MAGMKKLDAFVRVRPDLRSKSVAGGFITLVATSTAGLLFLAQIITYIMGRTHHSLHMAQSRAAPLLPLNSPNPQAWRHKILLDVSVTFPHVECSRLEFSHDGAKFSTGELKKHHREIMISFRRPIRSELVKIFGNQKLSNPNDGCTIEGTMQIPIVAGSLSIALNPTGWSEVTSLLSMRRSESDTQFSSKLQRYNVTHYVHHIRFGQPFPYAHDKPLENRYHKIANSFGGIALEQVQVKLVPTLYAGILTESDTTYQMSVTDHTVQPQTLVAHGVPHLPGLLVSYDFSPLAVRHSSGRDNIFIFLSSLISIVGGVFVTVGLVTGCLVHSAQAVAKKVD
eukprot:scaffold24898_cov173-Amphora_coffeaeformis.AAC.3